MADAGAIEFLKFVAGVVLTAGSVIVYVERRITALETKMEPLWEDYKERHDPNQTSLPFVKAQ